MTNLNNVGIYKMKSKIKLDLKAPTGSGSLCNISGLFL